MVLLYNEGDTVFSQSHTASSITGSNNSDLEKTVTSLQKMLKEREDTIVELKQEITKFMKVSLYTCITMKCSILFSDTLTLFFIS